MKKLKYGAKTYHSKVPLRFIKITIDYEEHKILENRTCYNKIITHHQYINTVKYIKRTTGLDLGSDCFSSIFVSFPLILLSCADSGVGFEPPSISQDIGFAMVKKL